MNVNTVKVILWGNTIGYLHQQDNGLIAFQYDDDFISSGIEVSPIKMPLSSVIYSFPSLQEETFKGLPGMMADSLPDKFGNIVLKRYLQSQNKTKDELNVLEKLCYTGKRGMGALEYEPIIDIADIDKDVDIDALTKLACEILTNKENFQSHFDDTMITQLMQSSSSVGGARAKTLIAWNQKTNCIRSGQINAGENFEYWLLKFDNISNNRDKDKTPDRKEYTKIEYAYYLMAKEAGIKMSECRLFKQNGLSHFITKRFDRKDNGEKIHMQTLCAIAHMDFNLPRVYSYEDAFNVMKQLNIKDSNYLQLYKRMLFNEYAKNYDDHTKNVSFLMDKSGKWCLAPAYDVTFAYNKNSIWTNSHQMLINNKANELTKNDMYAVAENVGIKKKSASECIEQVLSAVSKWDVFAKEAELSADSAKSIKKQIIVEE